MVDRERARFGAWYELFPRSQGRDPARPAATTFDDATWRLPEIARLGFDVVYLPPIHPIGRTNRKGANNTPEGQGRGPGQPVGHRLSGGRPRRGGVRSSAAWTALLRFREAVEAQGMELALDLAIQASPDHPWVREHPEWFSHAPDGTIKFAENPPKKYQDIYPIEFGNDDPEQRMALWTAWRDIVLTWVERGIRIFRVDNPHTKPIAFWRWLIADVQREHPDVIFLSEAFTRPKMMQQLAKIGFSQSYTYFTWRETRDELREYFTELTQTQMREYFRAEPVHQHAGHQPAPPGPRPAGLRDPQRAGRHARQQLRDLLRLGAVRERPARRSRGVPRQREVRDPCPRLGRGGQHQAADRRTQPRCAASGRPCSSATTCASSTPAASGRSSTARRCPPDRWTR